VQHTPLSFVLTILLSPTSQRIETSPAVKLAGLNSFLGLTFASNTFLANLIAPMVYPVALIISLAISTTLIKSFSPLLFSSMQLSNSLPLPFSIDFSSLTRYLLASLRNWLTPLPDGLA
jgi:hypothetical protein